MGRFLARLTLPEVRAETHAAKVNLVCHSLGGLDCRYVASPAGLVWDADDVDAKEVAEMSQIPVNTVYSRLRLARAAIVAAIGAALTLFGLVHSPFPVRR